MKHEELFKLMAHTFTAIFENQQMWTEPIPEGKFKSEIKETDKEIYFWFGFVNGNEKLEMSSGILKLDDISKDNIESMKLTFLQNKFMELMMQAFFGQTNLHNIRFKDIRDGIKKHLNYV